MSVDEPTLENVVEAMKEIKPRRQRASVEAISDKDFMVLMEERYPQLKEYNARLREYERTRPLIHTGIAPIDEYIDDLIRPECEIITKTNEPPND